MVKMGIVVWPHTSQFEVDVDLSYQLWLRNDHRREYAYRKAVEDLARTHLNAKHILDAGTGTGVWAIAMALLFPNAYVDGIDIHKQNIILARETARGFPTLEERLNFSVADINQYCQDKTDKKYDIICTELDGGVGNNEGGKRSFKSLQGMLSSQGIIIPTRIDTYIAPVSLEGINEQLPNTEANPFLQGKRILIKDPYSCYYLVYGAGSSSFIAEPKLLDLIETKGKIIEGYDKRLNFKITRNGRLTGFLVWFEHQLTDNVIFTNHPDFPITSWGQAYFPVRRLDVRQGDIISLNFSECVTEKGPVPHYNWVLLKNDVIIGKYSNEENQLRRI